MTNSPDLIKKIIDEERIRIEFQPIYSLNTRKFIGLEELARGYVGDTIVPPTEMFVYARENGLALRLDRICRSKAMQAFARQGNAPTLFLNFETSVLNSEGSGQDEVLRAASENGLSPQNIVIELNETKVSDPYNLMMFADFYRSKGFLIALDNVADGSETQNRIMLINPDIIKIDRNIVSGIDTDNYKQAVFRSVINIAKQIGAMTVAEGVETVDEVITCMLMEVDYFQGFYFQRPGSFNYLFTNEVRLRLEDAAQRLNISTKKNAAVNNMKVESYKRIIYDLVNRLACMEGDDYDAELKDYLRDNSEIECAFLIDKRGFQITETVISEDTVINDGFTPALKGVNHDIKNYFYAIKEQIEDPFISGWYTSNATGNRCRTLSSKFYGKNGEMIVVCVDLKA